LIMVAAVIAGLLALPVQAQEIRPDIGGGLLCTRMGATAFVYMMFCTEPPPRPPDYEQMTIHVPTVAREVCVAGGHPDWRVQTQIANGGLYVWCGGSGSARTQIWRS
jgi:hypothetical protein